MREAPYERHVDRAVAAITRRLSACLESLAADIERTPVAGAAMRATRAEAASTMARHSLVFLSGFNDALKHSLDEFVRAPILDEALNLGELELMDDARIQEEIDVAQVAQILAADNGEALHRLLKFESALRRSEGVKVTSSPIGPPALARALWRGSEALNLSLAARTEAVRAAARSLERSLGDVYKAVRKAGIADSVHEDIDDPQDLPPPSGFDLTRPGALFELLEPGEVGPPDVASDPVLRQDGAASQPTPRDGAGHRSPEIVPRRRGEPEALKDSAGSRRVLDLVGLLFEQIMADPTLSVEARAWLGRLHPCVVRLAGSDASLLQSHRHPAWMLVNGIAAQMMSDDGPVSPEFQRWLTSNVEQITADPSAAAFESAFGRLAHWQRAQAEDRLSEATSALELLRRNASLENQVATARSRLQRKLDSALPPSSVKRFVLTLWSLVCAQEMASPKADAASTASAMDIAIDLIWSTDAARSRADSPTLLAMMPILVEQLSAGMVAVGVPEAHRQAWLDKFAAHHLQALGRAAGAAVMAPITVDLALDDELPPPASEATPILPPESRLSLPYAGEPQPLASDLQVGDCLGLQLHGDWTDVQLLWMSDCGQFLLFAGMHNKRSHSFTRRALVLMEAEGMLRTVEERSALERATDEIVRRRG